MDLDFLLIRKMKCGDEEAFDLFIRKYYENILSYCHYHCRNREYAEDLTQETFIRFFSELSAYHHKGKAKNYLYTIANHLCIDYLRKKKEVPTEAGELTRKIEIEELEVLKNDGDRTVDRMALEAAMAKLSDELREVIVLYYFEDLKIREIADILQISVPLVKYRLARARGLLKNYWEKEDI